MIRDERNVIPVLLAALVHLAIFGSMAIAIDFSRHRPPTPLAIQATLVSEESLGPPPEPEPTPEEIRQREQEAERQRQLEAEQARIRAEQEAERERLAEEAAERERREDAERERQRIAAEEQRKREAAEKERQRQEAEKRREEELERQRQEAEKRRQEEVERQRLENERKRAEAEAARREEMLQQQLAEEAERMEAIESGAMDRYRFAITRKIEQNWVRPASATPGLECVINVRQVPGGEVISASIESCNGDAAVQRSIEAAVFKASPLPEPEDASLFERNLRITFKPEQ